MAEKYTPSDEEVQELIVGLLLDAGDYVRHGQPDPGETLTWNQREVRAWRAARLLSERHAHDARVKRDAAREALDGLVDWSRAEYDRARHESRTGGMALELHVQQAVSSYSRAHYPEETP